MQGGQGEGGGSDDQVDVTRTHTSDKSGPAITRTRGASGTPSGPLEFYELEEEVGRGGVGIVVRAHDRRLGRKVAIKQLQHPGLRERQRFEREMRITARLQHPGVVPIHESGAAPGGEPFYAMKLV